MDTGEGTPRWEGEARSVLMIQRPVCAHNFLLAILHFILSSIDMLFQHLICFEFGATETVSQEGSRDKSEPRASRSRRSCCTPQRALRGS